MAGAQMMSPSTKPVLCARGSDSHDRRSRLLAVYALADSSTEYGPSTPANRKLGQRLADHFGECRGRSAGIVKRRVRAGPPDALDRRGPHFPRRSPGLRRTPVFLAASLTRSQVGSPWNRAPRPSDRGCATNVNGTRSRTSGFLAARRWATTPVGSGAATSTSRPVVTSALVGPPGLADVDHPPPGDVPLERPRCLQFDFRPMRLSVIGARSRYRLFIGGFPNRLVGMGSRSLSGVCFLVGCAAG